MSYVTRRDGRYFYRRRFPIEVAALVGRTEFRKALGTADRKEADKSARIVSVEFDRVCTEALAQLSEQNIGESRGASDDTSTRATAEAILGRLHIVVEQATRSAIEALEPNQRIAPTWVAEVEWRKSALLAIAEGKHPGAAQYNPAEAMAAYRSLEALERGEVTSIEPSTQSINSARVTAHSLDSDSRTAVDFNEALEGYCARVSASRAGIVRSLSKLILQWPSTQVAQVQRIMQFAEGKLAAGGRASSVHTQAAGIITVLRELPGWERISLPRNGNTARTVRKGGQLQADARDAMPLDIVQKVYAALDVRGDVVDAAAARLLVRYGLRPLELLQEGPEALVDRVDILGQKELVYQAGLSGAKNSASRRCLPVHTEDVPLFKLVLGARGEAGEKRGRARVTRLSAAVRIALRGAPGKLSLYSLRHTCADLLRAAGATPDEVGGVLGHTTSGSKATSIYGGKAPLVRPRELLQVVRDLLENKKGIATPTA